MEGESRMIGPQGISNTTVISFQMRRDCKAVKEKATHVIIIDVIFIITHNPQLTFPDNDCDSVATLQLPVIGYRQGEFVRADLQTHHRGNSTVCIFNLHTLRTSRGGADGQKHVREVEKLR